MGDRRHNDLNLFKASLPALLPDSRHFPITISPTILFLQLENMSEISKKDREKFLRWCRTALNRLGFSDGLMKHEVKIVKETYDKEIDTEIKRGNYGVVLDCRIIAIDKRMPSQKLRHAAPNVQWKLVDIADAINLNSAFLKNNSFRRERFFNKTLNAQFHFSECIEQMHILSPRMLDNI